MEKFTKEFMGIQPISSVLCGDMLLKYEMDIKSGMAGFYLIPASMEGQESEHKYYRINNMMQYKLLGDIYPGAYGNGSTFHNSGSAKQMKYKEQQMEEDEEKKTITTILTDERGYVGKHIVRWYYTDKSIEMTMIFENHSQETVTLEALNSFEVGNLSPFVDAIGPNTLLVHRLRSKWSHEARLHTETVEDLQLEPSWSTWSVSVEKYGQTGSMPVKKFFPYVAIEDTQNGVLWGAQLAHEASWQMEVYRQDDALHICGGLADREFGHWMKNVAPGESFETPKAIVSVCAGGGVDHISQRLTQAGQKYANKAPKIEQTLPILFNEYCTTWGCPSHENISGIVEAIKDKGFAYFVIDCGWFKEDGVPWDISMGDYEISTTLFPEGLEKTVEMIKDAGMVPGIWFEIDNIGRAAHVYNEQTEHMLKKDGHVITTENRRFWDMTDPWVEDYLTKKVIGLLKEKGFGYMKMDYNDTIGIGCDGYESLGEGLRKNMDASVNFVRKVLSEVPGIVLENCSSGGHKLEPLMMGITSMASFSDAHETAEIPIIAANLHRAILPRQSQIWAVIRQKDSLKRIGYSIANTFLGRMCLSGDVTELSAEQWDIIERGMTFYREIAPIIKDGYTHRYGSKITSERHPEGWQGVLRVGENGEAFAVIHTFHGEMPEEMRVELPAGCPSTIAGTYSDTDIDVRVENGVLIYKTKENFKAAAVRLI